MSDIFNIIKSIYKKEALIVDKIDISLCTALTYILRLNKNNLTSLKKAIEYLYYIEPRRYLILLFVLIPYTKFPPYIKGVEKIKEEKENPIYNKVAYLFDWSKRELNYNKRILDKLNLNFLK